ncbi:hypothetical protein BKA62DRAFT_685508 [Auriculariales sp. MPI-PUGE-AT-0066]|nr:hypothetical protein BKA62DRAFT_685508 [Auriculariales sp. MPI-PUGE-AT-0066]
MDRNSSSSHYRIIELRRKSEYEEMLQGAVLVTSGVLTETSDSDNDTPASQIPVSSTLTTRTTAPQLSPTLSSSAASATSSSLPRTPSVQSSDQFYNTYTGGRISGQLLEPASKLDELPQHANGAVLSAKQMSNAHQQTIANLFDAMASARKMSERSPGAAFTPLSRRADDDGVPDPFNEDAAALFVGPLCPEKTVLHSRQALSRPIRPLSLLTSGTKLEESHGHPTPALRNAVCSASASPKEPGGKLASPSGSTFLRLPKSLSRSFLTLRLRLSSTTDDDDDIRFKVPRLQKPNISSTKSTSAALRHADNSSLPTSRSCRTDSQSETWLSTLDMTLNPGLQLHHRSQPKSRTRAESKDTRALPGKMLVNSSESPQPLSGDCRKPAKRATVLRYDQVLALRSGSTAASCSHNNTTRSYGLALPS